MTTDAHAKPARAEGESTGADGREPNGLESAERRSLIARAGAFIFTGGWLFLAMRAARSAPRRAARAFDTGVRAEEVGALVTLDRVVLARDARGEVVAMDRRCTHLGCLVGPSDDGAILVCPCHASAFTAEGEVLRGPATAPLRKLETTVDASGKVWVRGLD